MKEFINAIKQAEIKIGYDGGTFLVFPTNLEAEKVEWLLIKILRRTVCCFGQYENAYHLY